MPSKKRTGKPVVLPSVPKELMDLFVTGPMSAEAITAAGVAFKKALIERALGAELSHHLGYEAGVAKPDGADNQRNGSSGKTLLTDEGKLRIEVPRDRAGSFEPQLIPKHQRRFTGFKPALGLAKPDPGDKIVAMYARGMTVREIQAFLLEMYDTEVSPDFISTVTDAVLAEVMAWQSRPLDPMYPVMFFDALRVKIRKRYSFPTSGCHAAFGIISRAAACFALAHATGVRSSTGSPSFRRMTRCSTSVR